MAEQIPNAELMSVDEISKRLESVGGESSSEAKDVMINNVLYTAPAPVVNLIEMLAEKVRVYEIKADKG